MILPNQKNTPKNIYLADDDIDDREMFAEILLELDSSVILTQAEDGKQLMNILQVLPNRLPDVIFLDLNMPKQDGFECLKEIRNHNGHLKNLNIVIFTTSSDPNDMAKAFELGANFYVVKPNTFDGLRSLVSDVLQIDWFSPVLNTKKISTHLISPVRV